MQIELPEILNIAPKLLPIITEFNNYKYFLLEGGRGSSKSQSVARLLLYVAEQKKVRIVCGREIQNSIEESVYTLFKDLISSFNLNYSVYSNKIKHNATGSELFFKGFREQGAASIKGMEGVDIVWIDEAQSISENTLQTLIPTIRKSKAKLFFSMNRFMRDDAVYNFAAGRDDTLHIKVNYFENPFCPLSLKIEAEIQKNKSLRDYNHIWLGEPLATADDYLFNYEKLYKSYDIIPSGDLAFRQRIIGIDFAAQGNDQCVATILDRVSNQHWKVSEQIAWDEADSMISIGKIVSILGQFKPDVSILDVGGMGHVVWNRLQELGIDIKRFDGATTQSVDTVHYLNARAEGYYLLKEWFENEFLIIDKKDKLIIHELEKVKMKFRSNGRRQLESKVDMKKNLGFSPDRADSLMMAVYGAIKYLGKESNQYSDTKRITRIAGSKRKR